MKGIFTERRCTNLAFGLAPGPVGSVAQFRSPFKRSQAAAWAVSSLF